MGVAQCGCGVGQLRPIHLLGLTNTVLSASTAQQSRVCPWAVWGRGQATLRPHSGRRVGRPAVLVPGAVLSAPPELFISVLYTHSRTAQPRPPPRFMYYAPLCAARLQLCALRPQHRCAATQLVSIYKRWSWLPDSVVQLQLLTGLTVPCHAAICLSFSRSSTASRTVSPMAR